MQRRIKPSTPFAMAFCSAALACLILAGCGPSSLSGTYLPKGSGLGNGLVMEKLEFGSGNTVTLTMMEQKIRVEYEIDGKQRLLSANGQQMVFDIDSNGCLDGGGLYSKFCKGSIDLTQLGSFPWGGHLSDALVPTRLHRGSKGRFAQLFPVSRS